MIRAIFLLLLVILAATGPAAVFAVAAFVYLCMYRAFELVLLAACIDAYFGTGNVPYYFIVTTLTVLAAESVKPYLHVRTTTI